jgi:methyltransferase
MALMGRRLAVAFPDTVLEEKAALREKTAKLGVIARACAIYGVDVVEVFRDEGGRGETTLIRKVLEFLETPQYLRRRLFPLDESLRFAGLLPPLRIPSHKPRVPVESLKVGEVREGVANEDGTVDIGLETPARLKGGAEPAKRLTVRVETLRPLSASPVDREHVRGYWGYKVEAKSSNNVFDDPRFGLKVATSKLGEPLAAAVDALRAGLATTGGVKLVFGSPSRGLFDIVGQSLASKATFVVNLFGEQHVETVRTEEALMAGLNLVNVLSAEKA